jgi:hypothetical protein
MTTSRRPNELYENSFPWMIVHGAAERCRWTISAKYAAKTAVLPTGSPLM